VSEDGTPTAFATDAGTEVTWETTVDSAGVSPGSEDVGDDAELDEEVGEDLEAVVVEEGLLVPLVTLTSTSTSTISTTSPMVPKPMKEGESRLDAGGLAVLVLADASPVLFPPPLSLGVPLPPAPLAGGIFAAPLFLPGSVVLMSLLVALLVAAWRSRWWEWRSRLSARR
jgi:hypothetical protein